MTESEVWDDHEWCCDGSTFQKVEAATRKLRQPSCVLVNGTSMSWRSAERRFARTRNAGDWDADVLEVGRTVLTDTVKRRDSYFEQYLLWHWQPMKHITKGQSCARIVSMQYMYEIPIL